MALLPPLCCGEREREEGLERRVSGNTQGDSTMRWPLFDPVLATLLIGPCNISMPYLYGNSPCAYYISIPLSLWLSRVLYTAVCAKKPLSRTDRQTRERGLWPGGKSSFFLSSRSLCLRRRLVNPHFTHGIESFLSFLFYAFWGEGNRNA